LASQVTVQATFAATLVDEWARCGVVHAAVSPGSRSAPLATALARHGGYRLHMRLDERSAAHFALGAGLATGQPAIVLTTSGTAAAQLHAAVIEAHQAGVPLIVCTADRPPELRDVGAPQTVDQRALFGTALRWSVDPGVPAEEAAGSWRPLAARIVAAARDHPAGAGPVHVNLPFREPLGGEPAELPAPREGGDGWTVVTRPELPEPAELDRLAELLAGRRRGVVIAGEGCGALGAVYELATALGWPVIADPRAGDRHPSPVLVTTADSLLRHQGFALSYRPEAVLRLGAMPASKVLAQWLAGCAAPAHVAVDRRWPWQDPDGLASGVLVASPLLVAGALAERLAGHQPVDDGWLGAWRDAEARARGAIDEVLAAGAELSEPAIAQAVYAGVPAGATIFVSSSMPVRDLEWFAAPRSDPPAVLANRGANGIDGVTSTALGVAAASRGPVTALVGDLAFLHDLSALVWGAERPPPATIVVVDNSGGGIFSFLPQALQLPPALFEQLFGTPQSCDVASLAGAAGHEVLEPRSTEELVAAVAEPATALRVVVARTDRAANVDVHRAISEAVRAALG
jgi:2-succinyl-5-enolpyruvyl-6-hydroxy-3-cyclohexene-1-carboxylate synthase